MRTPVSICHMDSFTRLNYKQELKVVNHEDIIAVIIANFVDPIHYGSSGVENQITIPLSILVIRISVFEFV